MKYSGTAVSESEPQRALVAALLASTPDAMWVVSRAAELTHFNDAFARLCVKGGGRAPKGETPVRALAEQSPFHALWTELLPRALGGRPAGSDGRLVVDGVQRFYSIHGVPVVDGSEVVAAAFTARDVTDSAGHGRDDLFELSLTRLFVEGEKPLAETIADALEYVCESDEWDGAILWLLDEFGRELVPAAMHARPDVPQVDELRANLPRLRFGRGSGLPGRAWSEGDIISALDPGDESSISRLGLTEAMGLHGAVVVPIRDGPRTTGTLELFTRAVRPLSHARARALIRSGTGLGRLIERRRAEDERRRLQSLLERKGMEWTLTFDAIELPIFITSMDGVIRRVNRAARDLAGGDYSDVIGRRVATIDEVEPWITIAACVESVRDSEQPCNAQAFHPESDRSWDIAANWYRNPDDHAARAIVALRETTTLVQLQESVKRGEQLAALGELVAGVAHEVRNPIFGIELTVDALVSAIPDDPDIAEHLVTLRRWVDRLNRLMESLLAYGRTWSVDLEAGTVGAVLAHAIETVRPLADTAGVIIRPDADGGATILMDPSRLTHAFENLMTNAIQHSAAGQIVTVTIHSDGEQVECSFRDDGHGFSPADLPRVFQPFFTRRRGGTGLGLSIVQRIVDEHGGTVTAGNGDNGGAVVTVRFPIYKS
jgi:signal transduction histidine kinase